MAKKIPVSAPQPPLQNPFAALSSAGLPEGTVGPTVPSAPPKRPRIVLRREKSQRGGKTVVVVGQLPTHLSPPEIENLAKKAKQHLGCGGAVCGREIELQGDQPARVRHFFEQEGFQVGGV
ncbi:MAG: translation initiation factor [Terrimicrobiaceae bacterium]